MARSRSPPQTAATTSTPNPFQKSAGRRELLHAAARTPLRLALPFRPLQARHPHPIPDGGSLGGCGAHGRSVGAAGGGVGVPRRVGDARRRGRVHGPRQPRRRDAVALAPPRREVPMGAHAHARARVRRRGPRRRRGGGGLPHGARADPHVQREGGEALSTFGFGHHSYLYLKLSVCPHYIN